MFLFFISSCNEHYRKKINHGSLIIGIFLSFIFLLIAYLIYTYQKYRYIGIKSYIKCEGCDFICGIRDFISIKGICPGCNGTQFMVPQLLKTYITGREVTRTLTKIITTTHYRHEFIIHSMMDFERIMNMQKNIWKKAPLKWWEKK